MSPSKILVLNTGSSSLKFKIYKTATAVVADGNGLTALASGLCERIGDPSKSSIKVAYLRNSVLKKRTSNPRRSLHFSSFLSPSDAQASVSGDTSSSTVPPPRPTATHVPLPDHTSALACVYDWLKDQFHPEFVEDVRAVGHRVVHGLDLNKPVLITYVCEQI